jgi:hypothetical protein
MGIFGIWFNSSQLIEQMTLTRLVKLALMISGVVLYLLLSLIIGAYDKPEVFSEPYRSYFLRISNYVLRDYKWLTISFFLTYLVLVLIMFRAEAWQLIRRLSALLLLVLVLIGSLACVIFLIIQ